MTDFRIGKHPILPLKPNKTIELTWKSQTISALEGETIASALFAHGIHIFGHHHKDGSPQGIFCANGQCAQCMVLADHRPVKACVELVQPGMRVEPLDGLPQLPHETAVPAMSGIEIIQIPVLILGGGPAGLSAAIELGKRGIKVLLVDDKHRLGGKLVLQTHRFFGSTAAVYAGTRGIDIATRLEEEVKKYPSVEIWPQSTALAVFSDQKVGILKDGRQYKLIESEILLCATGAREKFLAFRGNTLPGVYGAGAFQTLVNRDMVLPSKRLFIVGGGNVGLIAGYHALQAGIEVVGLVEALPECGGYKVHRDKLARMGVPILTSHTILSANGTEGVESVTIAQIDQNFKPIPVTEQSFTCDSVLIAVGLDPVNEFEQKARQYGMKVLSAGDAEEIAEASAAIFSGKIKGVEIARLLGASDEEIPYEWQEMAGVLKSKPGQITSENLPDLSMGIRPVIHCSQEIPCNPCSTICPTGLIEIDEQDIRITPLFTGNAEDCKGCAKCVSICPGLAVTLVDYRKDAEWPVVTLPYEFLSATLQPGEAVDVADTTGVILGTFPVVDVRFIKSNDRTGLVKLKLPADIGRRAAGLRIQAAAVSEPETQYVTHLEDDTIICRCERVTAGEIRELIRQGCRDLNELKTVTRAGMGSCGSKTCSALIQRIFKEEGVPASEVVGFTRRPLFIEVPIGIFAGVGENQGGHHD
jgi:NADPH-dependent 2,4-dienoyl-CoA reductase/sulfur reductase-like enzyme/Fe-S-cluster-containing hydrogenase component 2/bacterioferritin-associated ferredoxin